MFPNFRSLSDRERKRQNLLKQYQQDLDNDEAKREAYKEAIWADEQIKNRINLLGKSNSMSTQTDITASFFSNTKNDSSSSPGSPSPAPPSSPGPEDIGDIDDSVSDIDENENDQTMQDQAKKRVRDIFRDKDDLMTIGYHPIGKDGKPIKSLALRNSGMTFNSKSGRPQSDDNVDWVLTEKYIINRYGLLTKLEIIGDKMKQRNVLLEWNRVTPTYPYRYPNEPPEDYVETQDDNDPEKEAIFIEEVKQENLINFEKFKILVANNQALLNSIFKQKINVVELNNGSLDKEAYYSIKNSAVGTRKQSKPFKPIDNWENKVNWYQTMKNVLDTVNQLKKIHQVNLEGTTITYDTSNKRGLADSTSSLKPDSQKPRELNSSDEMYQQRIKYIFNKLPMLVNEQIHPVMNDPVYKKSFDQRFIFGGNGEILFRETRKPLPRTERKSTMSKIAWGHSYKVIIETIQHIINTIGDRSDGSYPDFKKDLEETIKESQQITMSGKKSTVDEALEKFGFGLPKQSAKIKLEGRGLKGAGRTVLNLKTLEGTGTASDLKYKRLGSKFIRVKDLRENKLKIVWPNRSSVGKLRSISPDLSKLIDELLFNKNINQQLYSQLSLADKTLFHEILRITHLQHQFSTALNDPLEEVQAEFDKLRSQVMLGNNNPDLIRELKALAVDLYGQKLISENDFKNIVLI